MFALSSDADSLPANVVVGGQSLLCPGSCVLSLVSFYGLSDHVYRPCLSNALQLVVDGYELLIGDTVAVRL